MCVTVDGVLDNWIYRQLAGRGYKYIYNYDSVAVPHYLQITAANTISLFQ
jgi:hypothetical protein